MKANTRLQITFSSFTAIQAKKTSKPFDIFLFKADIPVLKVLIKININFGLTELPYFKNKKTCFEQLSCIFFQIPFTSSDSLYQILSNTIKHRLEPFSKTLARYFSTVLCLLANAVSVQAAQVGGKRKKEN